MKAVTKGVYCSLLAYLFCLPYSWTQNLIYSQAFDSGLDTWTVSDLNFNGGTWEAKANGKADDGNYWQDRARIATEEGAAVFDADKFSINNTGNPSLGYESALVSPPLNFSAQSKVYLKFNQYFRNFDAKARVQVSTDDGFTWTEVFNNGNVLANVETSNRAVEIVDISNVAAGAANVFIRFYFKGKNYFWIVDDVELYDAYPYPETAPEYFADSLFAFDYPFDVDTASWAYVSDEIVIQFKPGTLESEKQALRDTLGAVKIDSCVCEILELWKLGDNLLVDGQQLAANGGSIGVLERVNTAKGNSTVDGVDINRYNYNQLKSAGPSVLAALNTLPTGIPNSPSSATKIAILDTGVDYNHPDLINYIWKSSDTTFDDEDDDGSCYNDDAIGWNFIHDNNNPQDDHSHGTHLAGIIVNNILNNSTTNCDFRIIPYKTHDEHGISNLFDVTCATYLALQTGVEVINNSWGFYGDPSIILSNAFDSAELNYNTLIIAAAGNDAFNVGQSPQYPACLANDNVISVGAYDSLQIDVNQYEFPLSEFSNFDPACVDIVAPGNDILSTVPLNMGIVDNKSGTSMSAATVSAAAAISFCSGLADPKNVKDKILGCATQESDLQNRILDGNLLNFELDCLLEIEELELHQELEGHRKSVLLDFKVYPRPASDLLHFVVPIDFEALEISISDISGKRVFYQKKSNLSSGTIITLPVSSLNAGLYLINVRQNQYFWTEKFIKL